MNSPLVSFVVATKDCAATLERCLKSILLQDCPQYEILICDGASTDGTVDIIRRHASHLAWWVSSPDTGIYEAWNRAIPHCAGEWLCFLGADDELRDSEVLLRLKPCLERAGVDGVRFVYGMVALVDADGVIRARRGQEPGRVAWQLRHGMPVEMPHTGMFHHRWLFEQFGLFDTRFRIAGDYEFVVRTMRDAQHDMRFAPVLAINKGTQGVSFSARKEGILECLEARRKNGMRGVTLLWLAVYARAWLRELFLIG